MITDLRHVTGATEGYVRLYATVSQHKTKSVIKISQLFKPKKHKHQGRFLSQPLFDL
jgi:hypothetical protein